MNRFAPILRPAVVAAGLCALTAGLMVSRPRPAAADAGRASATRVIVSTLPESRDQPAFGTRVRVRGGRRVYVNLRDGFTLVDVNGGLVPVRTADAGRTWQIDGPSLYIPGAADSADTVEDFDAQSASTFYVYGGGSVVDVTSDGGRVWRQAIFQGLQAGVLPVRHGLLAYVDSFSTAHPLQTTTRRFVTTDGGRTWQLADASQSSLVSTRGVAPAGLAQRFQSLASVL